MTETRRLGEAGREANMAALTPARQIFISQEEVRFSSLDLDPGARNPVFMCILHPKRWEGHFSGGLYCLGLVKKPGLI